VAIASLIRAVASGCRDCSTGVAAALFPQLLPGGERPPLEPLLWDGEIPTLQPLPDALHEWYEAPPAGPASQVRVGVATLKAYADKPWVHQLLIAQKGQQEVAVAALGTFLLLLKPLHREQLLRWRWHCWPIAELRTACAPWLEELRQVGKVAGEPAGEPIGPLLAKFRNLLGRDLAEADWDAERKAALPSYSWRTLKGSRKKYLQAIYIALLESARSIVWALPQHLLNQTLQEFWVQRAISLPGGSSSERHALDESKAADRRISSNDRPNKKGVWQALSKEYIAEQLIAQRFDVARCSTKHEPGKKQRALYAQRDATAWAASYVSAGVEKAMTQQGMKPLQRPEDVQDWLEADNEALLYSERMWLSLDYHNFNKEHSNNELALVDLALAQALLEARKSGRGGDLGKIILALHLARLRHRGFVVHPGATAERSWSGLWSGHRNTARDNTMLHAAYARTVERQMLVLGCRPPIRKFYCGDDEDALHHSFKDLVVYYMLHVQGGWHFNPSKQMVGKRRHEFLQWQNERGRLAKPLAAATATLTMGNWYKQSALDFNSLATAAADHAVELVRRGADLTVVEDLFKHILGRTYRQKIPATSSPTAFCIPAGGGKTTLAAEMGWVDIDDLPVEADQKQLAKWRDAEDWDAGNAWYREAVADRHDWRIPLLAHSPEQLPPSWQIWVLCPTSELHEKAIARREPRHRELSRLNWLHLNSLTHTPYSTWGELRRLCLEKLGPRKTVVDLHFDWRAALGEEHPYVSGSPRVALPSRSVENLSLPALAAEDYIQAQSLWRPTKNQQQRLRSQLLDDAYKGLYRTWLNKQQRKALRALPLCEHSPPFTFKQHPDTTRSAAEKRCWQAAVKRSPITREAKAAAIGMHPTLVTHPWAGYYYASATQRTHYPLEDDIE